MVQAPLTRELRQLALAGSCSGSGPTVKIVDVATVWQQCLTIDTLARSLFVIMNANSALALLQWPSDVTRLRMALMLIAMPAVSNCVASPRFSQAAASRWRAVSVDARRLGCGSFNVLYNRGELDIKDAYMTEFLVRRAWCFMTILSMCTNVILHVEDLCKGPRSAQANPRICFMAV